MPGTPTPITPSLVGKPGRNLDRTVPESALDFSIEEVILGPLNAHLTDPVDAHDASAISITDPDDRVESTNVQGFVDEFGGSAKYSQGSGVVSVGTFVAAGLNLTFDANSTAIVNGSLVDFSGLVITLPNNQTRYVYLNTTRDLAVGAGAPNIVNGELPLWKVTTAAGAVTVTKDLRSFSRQAHRKASLSVCGPTTGADNRHSEGEFETLEAVINWIAAYAAGSTEKFTVRVRGAHILSSTLTLPGGNLTFIGEGHDAAISTGAVLAPMIDLAGQESVSFENLVFLAEHASVAIGDLTGGSHHGLVTRCKFLSGASNWVSAISINPAGGASSDYFTVELCEIEAQSVGVVFNRPNQNRIVDTAIVNLGATGTAGIQLGTPAIAIDVSQGFSTIRGCHITGYTTGIYLKGLDLRVEGSFLEGTVTTGINVASGGNCSILSTSIDVNSASGENGILINANNTKVMGCTLANTRAVWMAESPVGVLVNADSATVTGNTITGFWNPTASEGAGVRVAATFSDAVVTENILTTNPIVVYRADKVTVSNNHLTNTTANCPAIQMTGSRDFEVTGNHIDGNYATPVGIDIEGVDAANQDAQRFIVSNNSIREFAAVGILCSGLVQNGTITGNFIDGFNSADPFVPGAVAGIYLESFGGATDTVKYLTLTANQIQRCKSGIWGEGTTTPGNGLVGLTLSGNVIHHCGREIGGPTTFGDTTFGIGLMYGVGCVVVGNQISELGKGINASGAVGFPGGGASNVGSIGVHLRNCTQMTVTDNTIRDMFAQNTGTGTGIHVLMYDDTSENITISGNNIYNPATQGVVIEAGYATAAATSSIYNLQVNENTVDSTTLYGIHLLASNRGVFDMVSVGHNTINDLSNASSRAVLVTVDPISGIIPAGIVRNLGICHNTFHDIAKKGIRVNVGDTATLTDLDITNNQLQSCGDSSIEIIGGSTGNGASDFSRISIQNNSIVSGGGTNIIGVVCQDQNIVDLVVSGNRVSGSGVGIYIETTSSGLAEKVLANANISGNQVEASSYGLYVNLYGAWVRGVVTGNTFRSLISDRPMRLTLQASAYSTASDGLTFSNNLFSGGVGCLIYGDSVKIKNMTFTGCTFQDSGEELLLLNLDNGGTGANPALDGLTILGCNFTGAAGTAIRSFFDSNCDLARNVTIQGCSFSDVSNDSGYAATNYAIYLRWRCASYNINISGNQFRSLGNTDAGGSAVYLVMGRSGTTVSNLKVDGNTFGDITGGGILFTSALGFTAAYNGISFSKNDFKTLTNTAIYVDLTYIESSCRDVAICENKIASVSSGGPEDSGIRVIAIPSATAITLNRLRIDGNHVVNADSSGILFTASDCHHVSGLSICHNQIEGGTDGINVYGPGHDTKHFFDFQVNNNSVRSPTTSCYTLNIEAVVRNLQFQGNLGIGGTVGLSYVLGAGNHKAVSFIGNILREQTATNALDYPAASGGAAGELCVGNISDAGVGDADGWGNGASGFSNGFIVAANNYDGAI